MKLADHQAVTSGALLCCPACIYVFIVKTFNDYGLMLGLT